MAGDEADTFAHYAKLIESLLPAGGPTFEAAAEDAVSVQVERGLVLPIAMAGVDAARIDRVVDRLLSHSSVTFRVVDAAGHERPAYAGLLVYAWRASSAWIAARLSPAQAAEWRRALAAWCERPRDADDVVHRAWWSLATSAATLSSSRETNALHQLVAAQKPNGPLLRTDPSRNPETNWYDEMVLLHALAAYAAREVDDHVGAAACRAAEYHLKETQPDHATNEPWGLLAFIRNPRTHSLADQLLHNVRVNHPRGAGGVTAILLADVLDCLRRELARRSG